LITNGSVAFPVAGTIELAELAILECLDAHIARGMKMLMQSKAMKEIIDPSNNKAKIRAVGHSAEG